MGRHGRELGQPWGRERNVEYWDASSLRVRI